MAKKVYVFDYKQHPGGPFEAQDEAAFLSPEVAALLDPAMGNMASHPDRALWECDAVITSDDGALAECAQLKALRPVSVPQLTVEQRLKFGVLCARESYPEPYFMKWAEAWLSGADRSVESALRAEPVVSAEAAIRVVHAIDYADKVARGVVAAELEYVPPLEVARAALAAIKSTRASGRTIDLAKLAEEAISG